MFSLLASPQARSATRSPSRPLRTQRQHEDQHDEGEDVLVVGAQDAARQVADVACAERLDHAQQHAAEHGAREVADAAEHGRREGLQAGLEAHRVLHRAVVRGPHHAGQRGERRTDHEGRRDHRIGLDAHQAGDARVLGGGPHRPPSLVRLTRYISAASVTAVTTRIRIWTLLMTAPPIMCGSPGSRIGNDL